MYPSGNEFPKYCMTFPTIRHRGVILILRIPGKENRLFVLESNSWKRKSKARVTHAEERDQRAHA